MKDAFRRLLVLLDSVAHINEARITLLKYQLKLQEQRNAELLGMVNNLRREGGLMEKQLEETEAYRELAKRLVRR